MKWTCINYTNSFVEFKNFTVNVYNNDPWLQGLEGRPIKQVDVHGAKC